MIHNPWSTAPRVYAYALITCSTSKKDMKFTKHSILDNILDWLYQPMISATLPWETASFGLESFSWAAWFGSSSIEWGGSWLGFWGWIAFQLFTVTRSNGFDCYQCWDFGEKWRWQVILIPTIFCLHCGVDIRSSFSQETHSISDVGFSLQKK